MVCHSSLLLLPLVSVPCCVVLPHLHRHSAGWNQVSSYAQIHVALTGTVFSRIYKQVVTAHQTHAVQLMHELQGRDIPGSSSA